MAVSVLCGSAASVHAAGPGIVKDTLACSTTNPGTCGGVGTTSVTFNHTVAASGSNHYIVVGMAEVGSSFGYSAKYAGTTLTQIGSLQIVGSCDIALFGGVPAATGTNSVLVTLGSGGTNVGAFAVSFVNVGTKGAVLTGSASGNTTLTTSSSSGSPTVAVPQVMVDVGCLAATSPTVTTTAQTGNNSGSPTIQSIAKLTVASGANLGFGSWRSVASSATAPSYAVSGSGALSNIMAVVLTPANGTAIKVDDFTASQSGDGVDVRWRTGSEIDNLGFHVYRDDGRGRFRITATPIIGAALLTGSGISLAAGQPYRFRDVLNPGSAPALRYWLEDIDMNGTRTMHGPVYPVAAPAAAAPTLTPLSAPPSNLPVVTTLAVAPDPFVLPEAPLSAPAVVADGQSADLQWELASGAGVKIGVNRTGWHQLTGADLVAAGLPWSTDPRRLALFLEGREIPLDVRGGEDGVLGDSDTIGFYSRAINANSTDTRVYWLTDQVGSHVRLQPDAGSANASGPGATVSAVSAV
ncbi:MAG TPA: hypothetical protein VNO55_13810, partial [Polyangia bacterium]|nr:hypothetical protein [Polyangia bacterium]